MLPTITGTGRLVNDIELRFTSSGKAVAQARIAFSDRRKNDQGVWEDGDKVFLDATVWGDEAERVAECLPRGAEVLVSGKLRQREYDAKDGSKRVVFEVLFATIAPTLKYATVKVAKMERASSGGAPHGGADSDPWATQGAQQSRGSAVQRQSSFDESSEPPF